MPAAEAGGTEDAPMKTILAFYDIDREYGGPEEGGWWYDTGTFVRVIGLYLDEAEANRAQQRANRLLERLERHRAPVSSVSVTVPVVCAP